MKLNIAVAATARQLTRPFPATYVGQIRTEAKVVVGIDFGTTFSGISFVYRDSPTKVNCGAPGAKHERNEVKVPTVLLQESDGSWSFGNDALRRYNDLLESCEDDIAAGTARSRKDALEKKGVSLFRFFKMQLKDKHSGFETLTHKSTFGKEHKLMDLIVFSLQFLKQFALSELESGYGNALNISKKDIQWVVTTPAIWNDFGKAFMRKAAFVSGMIDDEASDKLLLALEPESASIAAFSEGKSLKIFKDGSVFMILDCGGGTVDITLHQVSTADPLVLDELCGPSGGDWGGIFVDVQFRIFLRKLFGAERYEYLEENYPVDLEEVMDTFREKKESFDPEDKSPIYISLSRLFPEELINGEPMPSLTKLLTVFNTGGDRLPFDLTNKAYKRRIEKFSTLVLTREQMLRFFAPTLAKICTAVEELLGKHPEVRTIVVVGGYGSSKALSKAIRGKFQTDDCDVVIPDMTIRPQAAVVHGAAYYGLYTTVIKSRVSRFTYGVSCSKRWFSGCGFPESEAVMDAKLGSKWVKDVFSSIVKQGQSISPLQTFKSEKFCPKYAEDKEVRFAIYKSDMYNPKRSTADCVKLGEISVPCRDINDRFDVEFSFAAELHVEIVRKDGQRYPTTVRME